MPVRQREEIQEVLRHELILEVVTFIVVDLKSEFASQEKTKKRQGQDSSREPQDNAAPSRRQTFAFRSGFFVAAGLEQLAGPQWLEKVTASSNTARQPFPGTAAHGITHGIQLVRRTRRPQ